MPGATQWVTRDKRGPARTPVGVTEGDGVPSDCFCSLRWSRFCCRFLASRRSLLGDTRFAFSLAAIRACCPSARFNRSCGFV